jgi:Tfp pilus tip-associated adhesin PilY1
MRYRKRRLTTLALGLLVGLGIALVSQVSWSIPYKDNVIDTTGTGGDKSWKDFQGLPLTSINKVSPLVMLVMSRDEQLFKKAYSDFTDLDGDGLLDTSYQDTFDYSGYFDSSLCYSYSTTNSRFKAAAAATGTNQHECTGATYWSGNFLNWLSMSRLDMVRYVLYGGYRNRALTGGDSASSTILERAHIPNDLHAWAKVYTGTDVNKFTPYSHDSTNPGISFCNASFSTTDQPRMRVARGTYPEWASTALNQCRWRKEVHTTTPAETCSGASGDNSCYDNAPATASLVGGDNGVTVRVEVCDPSSTYSESFCKKYGTTSSKPTGLLQTYGEDGRLRFGLVSGSFSQPRSGGILRRNIGKLAGNGTNPAACATGDEIKLSDGTFCNQTDGTEGIVNTLNRFKLTEWNGSKWNDCSDYSILNRNTTKHLDNPGTTSNGHKCNAWGNPLSEMYAEALRYITGETTATASFVAGTDLTGLPKATWVDPYGFDSSNKPRNPYCADCSILVLSTGLSSFDGDEVPAIVGKNNNLSTLLAAAAATKAVGEKENLSGKYYVGRSLNNLVATASETAGPQQTGADLSVGQNANTHEDICTGKTVTDLSQVRGICADVPAQEGSYLIAGLAYKAWTNDIRPDLKTAATPKPAEYRNVVQTYAVALAENLPKFQIPAGNNQFISLVPLCQAHNTGTAAITDADWRSCYLGNVTVGPKTATAGANFRSSPNEYYTYGRALENDGSAGSFSLVWEDSQWGNDHDNDVVSMITYCVGQKCALKTGTRLGNTRPVCFYENSDFSGIEWCPSSDKANIPNSNPNLRNKVSAVKVKSGFTVRLYDSVNQVTLLTTLSGGNHVLTSATGNDKADSYSITIPSGSSLDPLYEGHDICWRSDSTDVCGSSGTPTVAANEVLVRIENLSAYAGNGMLTGYAISGSSNDGVKRLARRPGNSNQSILTRSAEPPTDWDKPKVLKFQRGASEVKQLENPLFYAAKYGGFEHPSSATNPSPTTAASWDKINNDTGDMGADGLPDNFFPVRNPTQLKERLTSVFNDILRRVGSGTAAAVVANAREGQGAIYQALYEPSYLDAQGREVRWIGNLHALWIDDKGLLREDGSVTGGTAGKLDGYTIDQVVEIFFDETDRVTRFRRYADGPDSAFTVHPLTELKTVWNASKQLSALTDSSLAANRSYTASASTGRYIFTALDTAQTGKPGNANVQAFVPATFTNARYGILNVKSKIDADQIVNYTRGREVSGLRSRTADYDRSTSATEVMRLGDIVNSTPTAVGPPSEALDLLYNDASYAKFRAQYRDRRNVVYVGANDGMIHAFNAGFYNPTDKQFNTVPTTGSATAHPLGSELWAYVPYNLLPHLTWLTDPDYDHVWMMDGKPYVFDARIFDDDGEGGTHPGGWGTVMVIGMRLGGTALTLSKSNAATNSLNDFSGTSVTTRSAYVVLDITNPEIAPSLIAELSHAELGFTTSFPTGIATRNGANDEAWHLVFGSGPETANGGTSTSNAKLFIYDLKTNDYVSGYAPKSLTDAPGSFVGDPITVDWELDYKADAVYFGTVGGSTASPSGKLFKLDLKGSTDPSQWNSYVLANPAKPIIAAPSVATDDQGNQWVFAGTGRFLADDDRSSNAGQELFGLVDYKTTPPTPGTSQYTYGDLANVSDAKVDVAGNVSGIAISGISTETKLIDEITRTTRTDRGWRLTLAGSSPAERSVTQTSLLGGILFASVFTPSIDLCGGEGSSRLFGLNFKTGAASSIPVFGTTAGATGEDPRESLRVISLGAGLAASPSLHVGGARDQRGLTVFTQTSTGAIERRDAEVQGGVRSGEIDWQERQ